MAPPAPRPPDSHRPRLISWPAVLRGALLACLIVLLLYVTPTPYIFMAPGTTRTLSGVVHLEGGPPPPGGAFMLTTVLVERGRLLWWVYSFFDSQTRMVPASDMAPPTAEDEQWADRQMEESKYLAVAAALGAGGHPVKVRRLGVVVIGFLPASKAEGVLEREDRILAVNGRPVTRPADLSKAVHALPAGSSVQLAIRRHGTASLVTVPTYQRKGEPWIGIALDSPVVLAPLPVKVRIETQGIVGSSAGLMLTLEILRQMRHTDLTRGQVVAGTGAIDEIGRVGAIDGVRFKIVGARRAGAKYFLCPAENADEARAAGTDLTVIPVRTLKEALAALQRLPSSVSAGRP